MGHDAEQDRRDHTVDGDPVFMRGAVGVGLIRVYDKNTPPLGIPSGHHDEVSGWQAANIVRDISGAKLARRPVQICR